MAELNYELFTESAREGNPRPYKYVDILGNTWVVVWDMDSSTWSVAPVVDTYGNPAEKLAFFGETPRLLMKAVDDAAASWRERERIAEGARRAEAERLQRAMKDAEMLAIEQRNKAKTESGAGWFALLVVALLVLGDKGKRK
jgi:hypothetical protein